MTIIIHLYRVLRKISHERQSYERKLNIILLVPCYRLKRLYFSYGPSFQGQIEGFKSYSIALVVSCEKSFIKRSRKSSIRQTGASPFGNIPFCHSQRETASITLGSLAIICAMT